MLTYQLIKQLCKEKGVTVTLADYFGITVNHLLGFDEWDQESKRLEDKINAFFYQMRSLGWSYEWKDYDNMYTLSNGQISFKITDEQFSSLVENSQNFCKEQLQKIYEESVMYLFPSEAQKSSGLNAAHSRTDIDFTAEERAADEAMIDDGNE